VIFDDNSPLASCAKGIAKTPHVPHSPLLYFHYLSPLLPVASALFCRFLHRQKTQLFCFQAIPHSLPKTTGVGGDGIYPVGVAIHPCSKSFDCNTYEPPRKCCKQKTYGLAKSFSCNTYKKAGGPYPPLPLFLRIRGLEAVTLHVLVSHAPDGPARPGERELFGVEDERADEIRVVIVLRGLPPAGEWSEFTPRFSAESKSFIRIAGDFWHENPMMHATQFSAHSSAKWMLRGLRE